MFSIFKYISLPVFLLSFSFGLFFMYMFGVEDKPVYMYPSPDNINSIVYQDKANQCYVYRPIATKCNDETTPFKIQDFQSSI